MKKAIFLFLFAALLSGSRASAQEPTDGDSTRYKNYYISLLGLLSIPQNEFRQYSKTRGGFQIEVGVPFKATRALAAGAQVSVLFSGAKKDQFKGMEVATESMLINIQPLLRWAPVKPAKVKPFLDFTAGLTIVTTQTTSEIVDHATFLEEVLFGNETEVVTVTHRDESSAGFSYSVGAGFIISRWLSIGIRYQNVSLIKYVDKDKVFVNDTRVVYDERRIPIDMLSITLGISNWGSNR